MRISLIVAASTNNVIGRNGGLPWQLSADLKRFKEITMGKPIVMGRATWDSIGRALPGRQNIVMTRQVGFVAEGCDVASSVDHALRLAGNADEVMIIGGGAVYLQFLALANRIYLTRVDVVTDGDTFFPALTDADWQVTDRQPFLAGEQQQYDFELQVLDRTAS